MTGYWTPRPEWAGTDAYVIGGGPSLVGFPWHALRGRHTIGCNMAYRLGVCEFLVFGDPAWFDHFGADLLATYTGRIVTNAGGISHPRVAKMRRHTYGLHRDGLGWNGNTGAAALNLALLLGAARVFLLGFDMRLGAAGANWHNWRYEPAHAEVYNRFLENFARVAEDLPRVFPGARVFTATDDQEAARLRVFPFVTVAEALAGDTGPRHVTDTPPDDAPAAATAVDMPDTGEEAQDGTDNGDEGW